MGVCNKVQIAREVRLVLFVVVSLAISNTMLADSVWAKQYVVGISTWSNYARNVEGFKQALIDSGIEEGGSVRFVERSAGADKAQQHSIAKEFAEMKVDLVYSLTTPGTVIIKQIMPIEIPIVFSIVTYPADSGLIESYEYSGNNLVGTSNFVPLSNFVTLLRGINPSAKRVTIFHRTGEPNSKIQAISLKRLFRKAKIEVVDLEASDLIELKALAQQQQGKTDVFVTTTDTLMQGGGEKVLIDVAKVLGIPVLSSNKKGIEGGATFGPVADFYTLGQMSGNMAVKILKGEAAPTDLSSKLMDPPLFLVNKKALAAANLTVPTAMKNVEYAGD